MMDTNLSFETRQTGLNKTALKNKRLAGQIPATLFGKTFTSTPVFVKANSSQIRGLHSGSMFKFDWNGKNYRATLSEIQKDSLAREITHLSFHVIRHDELITVELPITIEGRAAGEKFGGLTTLLMQTLAVRGLPDAIPESIVIDAHALELGSRICVSDVRLPKGLTSPESANKEQTVVICLAPRKETEATVITAAAITETP